MYGLSLFKDEQASNSTHIIFQLRIIMGLSGKEELSVEIKSPGEFFFDVFGTKKALLPKICPNLIPRIDLLEGEWGTSGCTILVHSHLGKT